MRGNGKRSKARAGVTLVEVMLAGALTSFVVLTTLEGFTFSGVIATANCTTLHADNVAFDLIWREFREDWDTLEKLAGKETPVKATWETDSPYHSNTLATKETEYPQFKYKIKVDRDSRGRGLFLTLTLGDTAFTGAEDNHLLRKFTIFRANMND